jgi:hypothetical protein
MTTFRAAIVSRRDTATDSAATPANTAMLGTAVAADCPVIAPSAAAPPISGATPSCHQNRVLAGASKATKPVIDAPIVTAPVTGVFSSSSTSAAMATGIATRKPRRIDGAAAPRRRQLSGIRAMCPR